MSNDEGSHGPLTKLGRHNSQRRDVLRASLAGTLVTATAGSPLLARNGIKRDIVLVHGAWHGGWCWAPVRDMLERAGHRVYTPTLTGLGDRADELSAEVGLDTHIDDVLLTILLEELDDVVLCGHSYGGMVITEVADRAKARIGHIVYLDAALPKNGETMLSYGEPRPAAAIEGAEAAMRAMAPDGIGIATFPPSVLGVPQDHPLHNWVAKQLTPHPLKTWLDPINLKNGGADKLPRTYVHCTDPVLPQTQFPWVAAQVKDDPTWNYAELATGHDAMVTAPAAVADLLEKAAHSDTLQKGAE